MSQLRLVLVFVTLFAGSLVLVMGRPSQTLEISQNIILWTLMLTGPVFIVLATEPDALDEVPESRLRTRYPWHAPVLFPGGGRGLLLLLLSLSWLLGCHVLGRWQSSRPVLIAHEDTTQLAMLCMYSWIYVSLPSTLLVACGCFRLPTWARRLGLVGTVILSWFLAFPIGAYISDDAARALFPFEMMDAVKRNGELTERGKAAFSLLCIVSALSLLAALPRMARGVREVRG